MRIRSDYSLGKSTIKIENIIQEAKKLKLSSISICEYENLSSLAELSYKKGPHLKLLAQFETVVEILGTMIPFVIVIQNETGYQRALKYLNTRNFDELLQPGIIAVPILDVQNFEQLEHLIPTIKSYFKQNFVMFGLENILVINKELFDRLAALEIQQKIRFLYMNVVNHLEKMEIALQLLGETTSQIETKFTNFLYAEHKNFNEYEKLLVNRNQTFHEHNTFELKYSTQHIPEFDSAIDSVEKLKSLTDRGAKKRYKIVTDEIRERIDFEMDTIFQLGYENYFLILWDVKKYAFEHNILIGPGRGSSVGSIVAYCLGITSVDPLKYNLLFERFLNPLRKSMPDIDIDIEDTKRIDIIEYLKQKYGKSRVGQIITYSTLQEKSIQKAIDLWEKKENATENFHITKTAKEQAVKSLVGVKQHASKHAAGIIISATNLLEEIPMDLETGVLQWRMEELERYGKIKFDFLGLSNLTFLKSLIKEVRKETKEFNLEEIKGDDQKTFSLLANKHTIGIFQLEGAGISECLSQVKPSSIVELGTVLALYRPGPIDNIPLYVQRKNTENKNFEIPSNLDNILSETYGIIVFQEQIMQITQVMAGYNLGEADNFRRAISKKNHELFEAEIIRFKNRCRENKMDKKDIDIIAENLISFADYGFVKSHAIAYAKIAYNLAYIKTNYPLHFYKVLLNENMKNTKKIIEIRAEMRRQNIEIVHPNINHSYYFSEIVNNKIELGIGFINSVNKDVFEKIRSVSEEYNVSEVVKSLLQANIEVSVIELLIKGGSFSHFNVTKKDLLDYLTTRAKSLLEFENVNLLLGIKDEIVGRGDEFSNDELTMFDFEAYGTYLFYHPFLQFLKFYDTGQLIVIEALESKGKGKFTVVAKLDRINPHTDKNGKPLAFCTISDHTNTIDAVIFADVYSRVQDQLKVYNLYKFEVLISTWKNKTSYNIVKVSKISL